MRAEYRVPRTAYYGLELLSRGTDQVEGVASYIQRLAWAHNMSPRHLLQELCPRIASDKRRRHNLDVNGIGEHARAVVEQIHHLTGVDIRDGSLLKFGEFLGEVGLARRDTTLICVDCMRGTEDVEICHTRLLWQISAVVACPIHGTRLALVSACGTAPQHQLRRTARPAIPGACPACGSVGYRCRGEPISATHAEIDLAQQIGAVVALRAEGMTSVNRDTLLAGIRAIVEDCFDGMPVRAASAAGLGRTSVFGWLSGDGRISLSSLLRLTAAANADLLSAFQGVHRPRSGASIMSTASMPPARNYVRHDWDDLRKILTDRVAMGNPPSLYATAREFRIDFRQLKERLPDESRLLLELGRRGREEKDRRSLERHIERMSSAAARLIAEGRPVTRAGIARNAGAYAKANKVGRRAMDIVLQAHGASGLGSEPEGTENGLESR